MRSNLATVALRPSGIFGEHDPLLVPLTVANARKGKMKFIIGSGKNLMDFTYVGNVAQAHLLVSNPPLLPHIMALFFMLPCKSSRTCEGLVLSTTSIDACGAVRLWRELDVLMCQMGNASKLSPALLKI